MGTGLPHIVTVTTANGHGMILGHQLPPRLQIRMLSEPDEIMGSPHSFLCIPGEAVLLQKAFEPFGEGSQAQRPAF